MLVLSRKKDEKILIGDNVEVMVVSVEGSKVKLGIKAPKEVGIHREEIIVNMDQLNKEACVVAS